MKCFWKDGALNLMPESEEDGAITSAILFAFGSHPSEVVLAVNADRVCDNTNEQAIIGVDVGLDGVIDIVPSGIASHEPLGKENSVSADGL
jgi:hypothetical protein